MNAISLRLGQLFLAGAISTGILVPTVGKEAQDIPKKVWEETDANIETVAELEVPQKILQEVEVKPENCPTHGQDERNLFSAYKFESAGITLIAIKGGGACRCSPTGNCSFWVYRDLSGRYVRILSTSMVQSFGFLKLKSRGLPDVVLWSHGSAFESGARLWQFNGVRYIKRCNWEVVLEADSGESQIRNNTCKALNTTEGVSAPKQ